MGGWQVEGAGDGKGGVAAGKKGVADAFLASLSMILVTEVLDARNPKP